MDGQGATHADGPCFDNANRYVNCGNGTVTDTVTGLIWLQQESCLDDATYSAGNQAAAALANGQCDLTDGSSAGDWRLPTRDEWSATFARAVALNCTTGGPGIPPTLTNDAGTGCLLSDGGSSFTGVASVSYWSSTTTAAFPTFALLAFLGSGSSGNFSKDDALRVWPVRGGPR